MEKTMEHELNFGGNMDMQRIQGLGLGLACLKFNKHCRNEETHLGFRVASRE